MKPVVIQVFGDKTRKLEPEHHRIEFPGGAIHLDRCTDGTYWAHISLNVESYPNTHSGQVRSRVVASRVDFDYQEYKRRHDTGEPTIPDIPGMAQAQHFAVHIQPEWPEESAA